jgi:hypothetical protein
MFGSIAAFPSGVSICCFCTLEVQLNRKYPKKIRAIMHNLNPKLLFHFEKEKVLTVNASIIIVNQIVIVYDN